jgi:hypothetical protein
MADGRVWQCPICGEQVDLEDRDAESPNNHLDWHEMAERLDGERPVWQGT